MPGVLFQVLTFALLPVAATIAGGVIATYRPPGPRVRSAIQHFAAGVVFAAVAVELLPDIVHERAPVAAAIGFALGVGLLLLIKWATERSGQRGLETTSGATSLIVTLGIDIAIDGLLIGIGLATGGKQGTLILVALTLEVLFLGLSAAASLGNSGASRGRTIGTVVGLSALLMVGAAVGALLLGGLSGSPREAVLTFGAAALLYLVTEELLVEAHEVPETSAITATFFVGFLLLLIIDMIA